eukprot:gene1133-1691_t
MGIKWDQSPLQGGMVTTMSPTAVSYGTPSAKRASRHQTLSSMVLYNNDAVSSPMAGGVASPVDQDAAFFIGRARSSTVGAMPDINHLNRREEGAVFPRLPSLKIPPPDVTSPTTFSTSTTGAEDGGQVKGILKSALKQQDEPQAHASPASSESSTVDSVYWLLKQEMMHRRHAEDRSTNLQKEVEALK